MTPIIQSNCKSIRLFKGVNPIVPLSWVQTSEQHVVVFMFGNREKETSYDEEKVEDLWSQLPGGFGGGEALPL